MSPLSRLLVCLAVLCASAAQAQEENVLISMLREEASNLELGNGVEKDGARAAALYCEASRLGDVDSQFRLGWMYTNGSGVDRSDAVAAFFFQIAAEQGMEQAQRMLKVVGGPTTDVPECMREPVKSAAAATPAARRPVVAIAAPPSILKLVTRIAPEYRVEPQLALAIIEAESNFDTVALSPRNAKGLMQLIPDTAARFHVRNPYDPAQNIRGGIAYLRWLLAYFEGDVALVAAAYNAGEGAVERYRGVPPYVETRAYVRKILASVGTQAHPFDASVTPPSPQLALIRQPRRMH
ncbi:MAG TPA: transglycosylase SLT domain-containing protein [Albitalea sp.]|uniref:transglycosylase SLT domain-containing protein n=1 Tax=Piscinibacter sp. TaxID=1903157 RepID=UPI002ED55675